LSIVLARCGDGKLPVAAARAASNAHRGHSGSRHGTGGSQTARSTPNQRRRNATGGDPAGGTVETGRETL
jgi:hypothetical protein